MKLAERLNQLARERSAPDSSEEEEDSEEDEIDEVIEQTYQTTIRSESNMSIEDNRSLSTFVIGCYQLSLSLFQYQIDQKSCFHRALLHRQKKTAPNRSRDGKRTIHSQKRATKTTKKTRRARCSMIFRKWSFKDRNQKARAKNSQTSGKISKNCHF